MKYGNKHFASLRALGFLELLFIFNNIKECTRLGSQYHSSRFIAVSVYYAVNKTTAEMVNGLFELSSTSQ